METLCYAIALIVLIYRFLIIVVLEKEYKLNLYSIYLDLFLSFVVLVLFLITIQNIKNDGPSTMLIGFLILESNYYICKAQIKKKKRRLYENK